MNLGYNLIFIINNTKSDWGKICNVTQRCYFSETESSLADLIKAEALHKIEIWHLLDFDLNNLDCKKLREYSKNLRKSSKKLIYSYDKFSDINISVKDLSAENYLLDLSRNSKVHDQIRLWLKIGPIELIKVFGGKFIISSWETFVEQYGLAQDNILRGFGPYLFLDQELTFLALSWLEVLAGEDLLNETMLAEYSDLKS